MRRQVRAVVVLGGCGAVVGGAAALAGGEALQETYRLKRFETPASLASLPFPVDPDLVDPSGIETPADLLELPPILGEDFDPTLIDEIAVAGGGNVVAWATTVTEQGIPGTTRDVVVRREGDDTAFRLSDATGDNDQPSIDFDSRGWRLAFRGSDGAREETPGNVYLATFVKAPPGDGGDGGGEGGDGEGEGDGETPAATDTVEVVKVTSLGSGGAEGSAYDPSLAARIRVRSVGSGVNVHERDARIAFVSTGDLLARGDDPGPNPDLLPQLFRWHEADTRLEQLTRVTDPEADLRRPSISGSGTRIAFECTADLTPAAADPKDPSRVGNPDGVRQIYLWDSRAGIRQLTWSDGDCFSPRIGGNGRFVLFCSRGDVIRGGNPDRNFEIFSWVDGGNASRRLRQLTDVRPAEGTPEGAPAAHSVLPRPTGSAHTFVFWTTALPQVGEEVGFGGGPSLGPAAFLHRRGKITPVASFRDGDNLGRLLLDPAENPILLGPPAVGSDPARVHFVTNHYTLNEKKADDDLDGANGDDPDTEEVEPDDRKEDASVLVYHLARATRHAPQR